MPELHHQFTQALESFAEGLRMVFAQDWFNLMQCVARHITGVFAPGLEFLRRCAQFTAIWLGGAFGSELKGT